MIDPINMTQYDLSKPDLEEVILFCCAVAGKNALTTAKALDKFLIGLRADCSTLWDTEGSPFVLLRCGWRHDLAQRIKSCGMGCFNHRARTFLALAHSGLDLKTCTVEELEKIPGIGPKTSRYFLLHTRRDVRVAVLDTHILRYMSDLGHEVPRSTPTGKRYLDLEQTFIGLADLSQKSLAQFDLDIWNEYRK
jgi:hypothetical protein